MRRLLALVFLAVLAVAEARAQTGYVEGFVIDGFGTYEAKERGSREAESTATGTVNVVSNLRRVAQTETIPARLGTRFGVKYRVLGRPKGGDIVLTMITRFPAGGLTNGKGEKFEKNEVMVRGKLGIEAYRTYRFDNAWELVPGEWVMEFHHKGKKLGEKKFTVVKP